MLSKKSQAEELLDHHAQLRELVQRVRECIMSRGSNPRIVCELIHDLAEHVLEHFQHEEQGGYFAHAIELAPRLAGEAQVLLRQHPDMSVQLDELREHSSVTVVSPSWWEELEEQILFPAVRALESAAQKPTFPFGTVQNPTNMMEHEHQNAGNALRRLRERTDGYPVSPARCRSSRTRSVSLEPCRT